VLERYFWRMPRPNLKLGLPDVAAIIDKRHTKESDPWRKNRLLAVKLAARGEHTAAAIADLCGIARGHLFTWIKIVREQGLEALLERGKRGPKEGTCRGLEPNVAAELKVKLAAGEFVTAVQAQRWLAEKHGVKRGYQTVWQWLKKAGGVLLAPRPSHSKKDPAAAQEFRDGLAAKLEALQIEPGSRVKLWLMDEARFGLHTEMRRLWALKGKRPVVTRQIKYEWDYLYGSLDAISGQAHFCQIPAVNQQWDRVYLEDLAATDTTAVHVIIRDQAGFHLRDGDERLPARVRIIDLPPYNPELNPCEQLWDMIKDEIGNRVFESVEQLREAMLPALQRFWDDASAVLSLIGRDWLGDQANATHPIQKSA
jgi:transposase